MALLFFDGFEGYADNIANILPATFSTSSVGMPGKWVGYSSFTITANGFTVQPNGYTRCLTALNITTCYASLSIPSTSNIFVGLNYYCQNFAGNTSAIIVLSGTANTLNPATGLRVKLNNDGSVSVQTANGGTNFLTTPTGIFSAGWHVVELNAVFGSGTSGSFELRIDGTSYTASGINTAGGMAGSGYTYVNLQSPGTGGPFWMYFDDFYVFDNTGTTNNTFLGAPAVYTLFPASNGTVNSFTAFGAASNWQAVDQTSSVSASKYNYVSTTGSQDLYYINNIGITPTAICGVYMTSMTVKQANGPGSISNQCIVSGTTATGATIPTQAAVWLKSEDLLLNQPNGSAWTLTAVNNMQIGVTT